MATIQVEIITPSKLFYKGEVDMVIARTVGGEEGFMAGHAWACKLLEVSELWLKEPGAKDYKEAAIAGGYIDVKDSIVIYTDAAEWKEDIDAERAQRDKDTAEKWLHDDQEHDPDKVARAQVQLAKSIIRMKVAKGNGKRR